MSINSKRQAWMIAECRAFLKEAYPAIYAKVNQVARTHFPDASRGHTDRQNVVTMAIVNLVKTRYREKWREIENHAKSIYGGRDKRLSYIAWDIALSLYDDEKAAALHARAMRTYNHYRLSRNPDGTFAAADAAREPADDHSGERCAADDDVQHLPLG
jgi:hypothetical protein